ncbi:MAG: DUF4962 domain-containing protein [Lentisphaerae bacterium]|nr:DUF4962 domain-containing protein [Lentisphaerota bacterium]
MTDTFAACRLFRHVCTTALILGAALVVGAEPPSVNEAPAQANEWGFRPIDGQRSEVNPPAFSWRPQDKARSYILDVSATPDFSSSQYHAEELSYNVHCPPQSFPGGTWYWRFAYRTGDGRQSSWSSTRSFSVDEDSAILPLPTRAELMSRVPTTHPRLFIRPEQLGELRQRAQTDLKPIFDNLCRQCDAMLAKPPPTEEPSKYPLGMVRNSDEWRGIWWGNRVYTIKALDGAATLAFTRLIGGKDEYGQLAKRILMDCAKWDPKGATGYRYNDEAGMPYNSRFARTYSYVYDLLSEEERAECRDLMRIRGEEMYRHLFPRHLWAPYASHSNRAWHFLGEVALAFLGEIPEAEEWLWFAMNVYACVYPVWSDADGGWHEGVLYWHSYIDRFTWWADIMKSAMGINAFAKPYFASIGYYPMYLQPPGTKDGGFGDLVENKKPNMNATLVSILAAQAQNPYWQWYVDAIGGAKVQNTYIGFVRGAMPAVAAKPPVDLPSSRCFRGTGQAMLNSNLFGGEDNVQLVFKSSPFGTQSHGYESNNAFLFNAYGERLLIRTGRRDSYGSEHHKNWMWETKSVNSISVNGEGQTKHSAESQGEITDFACTPLFDYVAGEAAKAYDGRLNSFKRRILFYKPDAVVIFDTLDAVKAATFDFYLHAINAMDIRSQQDIRVQNNGAACQVAMLWPNNLAITQTDKFDPPPRPRIKVVEYHLTAQTRQPQRQVEFVTVIRPYRADQDLPGNPSLEKTSDGFALAIPVKAAAGSSSAASNTLKVTFNPAADDVQALLLDSAERVIGSFASGQK